MFLVQRYSARNMSGKLKCKLSLQKELGFEQSPQIPLLGFVGRLDHQKGPDIVLDAVDSLTLEGCQIVMLGSGDIQHEARMKRMEEENRCIFLIKTVSILFLNTSCETMEGRILGKTAWLY